MPSKNIKDFLYVVLGQGIGMAVSIVRSLILPLYLTVLDFGYLQSYLFYISLIPIITIGYNDGVYLRYGKFRYEKLPFSLLASSNSYFTIMLIVFSILISVISTLFVDDCRLRNVIYFSCLYGVFYSLNTLVLQIYQVTQKFFEYTVFSLLPRILSLIGVISLLAMGVYNSLYLIVVDLITFIAVTLVLMLREKRLFVGNRQSTGGFAEFSNNIVAGFPLLIAGLIGILYFGAGRFIVQVFGGLEEFAVFSFALSIASFVSVAISAVSTVVYPMIARYSINQMRETYWQINNYLKVCIIAIIPIYCIAKIAVLILYPGYSDVLEYLSIVIAMTYLQSYIYVLHNTYYKTLRLEKKLLTDNIVPIMCLFILGVPVFYFTRNIIVIPIVTLVALLLRYFISCKRLSKTMKIESIYNYGELLFLLLFILSSQMQVLIYEMITMFTLTILYVIINYNNIKALIKK